MYDPRLKTFIRVEDAGSYDDTLIDVRNCDGFEISVTNIPVNESQKRKRSEV